jgi:hypothetical protein
MAILMKTSNGWMMVCEFLITCFSEHPRSGGRRLLGSDVEEVRMLQ